MQRQTYSYLPVTEHRHRLAGTKLYCLMTEAYVCEQLAHSHYMNVEQEQPRIEPVDCKSSTLTTMLPQWRLTHQ